MIAPFILLSLLTVGPAAAQTIDLVNANFESPTLGGGNWQYLSDDRQANGWTFSGSGGITGNSSPWVGAVADGIQVAFLQGETTMSQAITVAEAGSYTLRFLAANRPNYLADNLAVQIDGTTVASWPAASFSGGIFTAFTTNITLADGQHTLALVGTSPGGDTATLVDQVTLRLVVSSQVDTNGTGMETNAAVADPLGTTNFVQVNASFELPLYGSGQWQYLTEDSQINGWTFSGSGGIASGSTPWVWAVTDGAQVAFLQGETTMSQAVSVPDAGCFKLSFLAANRPNCGADNLAVQIDGTPVAYWAATNFSGGAFVALATNLTLTAGTHRLAFVGTSPGGDTATLVDRIALNVVFLSETNPVGGDTNQTDVVPDPTNSVPEVAPVCELANAGFEWPALAAGDWRQPKSDGLTNGWKFTGAGGIASYTSPWLWVVPEGAQAAFLQGNSTMSQKIVIAEAGRYCIRFLAANRLNFGADNLALQIDGTNVAYWSADRFSGGKFNGFLTVVTLAAGTHRLTFVGTSPGGDTTTLIDQVSIFRPNFIQISDHVMQSDGSDTDTQIAIEAARDGDTIQLPAGNFTWSNGVVVLGKAVKIVGAGAGALFANSTSKVTVGTGTQEFAVRSNGWAKVTTGMTVTAYYTASGAAGGSFNNPAVNMTGKVTSFDGTYLQLEVTAANGSGTYGLWTFAVHSASTTVITNSCTKGAAFHFVPPPVGNVELAGVHIYNSDDASWRGNGVDIEDGGGLVQVHDCWFEVGNTGARAIEARSNHGLVYRCSFDNRFDAGVNHNGLGNNGSALTFKPVRLTDSWSNNATMGRDDSGGTNNFYVEDCYEAGIWSGGTDFDDNSRVVVRHCVFDNSVCGSHGQETSPFGVRHFELYHNDFVFTEAGMATFNLNWWLFLRGGTGVIFSNTMPNIASQTWGDKAELTFVVMYPYRLGGQTNYPAPHQIGQSWHDGRAITDPVYFWDNPGLPTTKPCLGGYPAGEPQSCYSINGYPAGKPDATNAPPISWYLQAGRDFSNSVKPGYTPYPYPHPLRVDIVLGHQPATAAASAVEMAPMIQPPSPPTNVLPPPQQFRVIEIAP